MGANWIKISVVYLVMGILFGLFMHYTIQLQWGATHGHINVVGWLSTGLIGVIYAVYPKVGNSRLGVIHFWLQNISLPFLLVGMMLIHTDFPRWMMEFCVSSGGIGFALAILIFLVNIFQNVEPTHNMK
ncbi:hypothetical protein [Solibacillus sp. FSL K6-1523]|uniref:hypothetical protein n=1 Tax=Solibacillus sp. FSL K6-1523 TaxID=2921471 RepID=UPI0030FBF3CF